MILKGRVQCKYVMDFLCERLSYGNLIYLKLKGTKINSLGFFLKSAMFGNYKKILVSTMHYIVHCISVQISMYCLYVLGATVA